jgi:hypothetical protein
MEHDERTSAQLVATAILGGLLLQPMVIHLFDVGPEADVFGVPIFFVYLFVVWVVIIALMAFAIFRGRGSEDDGDKVRVVPRSELRRTGTEKTPAADARRGQ